MTCYGISFRCSGTANCLQYNNKNLSMVVLVTNIIAKIVITTCYFIAHLFRPKDPVHAQQESDAFKKRKEIHLNCENGKSIVRETIVANGGYCFNGLEHLDSRETKL